MGSKIEARRTMREHGLPVVPGASPSDQSDEAIADAVGRVGLPALLKPAAGGGGIGMRIVSHAHESAHAAASARREALAAFGDGTLYVERFVDRPRHVEIQVLADHHGAVVHLFERECSLQRRHQKVIEESPSPAITADLRERMGDAAVAAARACGYRNAGTIEFLVEGAGDQARFYFLEMNTRLQVEHPVTEAVTGIDLVQAQIRIAAGEALPWSQRDIVQRGHAIECRAYAEDPLNDFLPQAGPLRFYLEPRGPGIRVDSGVRQGGEVPVHYDPLLAKLIVHAENRALAIARLEVALAQFAVLGIQTNLGYLRRLVQHPAFVAGQVDTRFLDRETGAICGGLGERPVPLAAIVAAVAHGSRREPAPRGPASVGLDPWETLGRWRGSR
jgi:acetyl/propionyl-CoA carboxylase alpha subunit